MAEWKLWRTETIDGVELRIYEEARAGRYADWRVQAYITGTLVYEECIRWNVWLGHAYGQLLLPMIVEKTRQLGFVVATELDLAGREAYIQADLVIAVCGDQSYIIKSRKDTKGLTHVTPRRPDTVIAYYPGSRDVNNVARSEVLQFRWSAREPKVTEPTDDGWIYTSDVPRPPHGGQVSVSFMVGNNGPFVGSARRESGDWEFGGKHNPAVEVIAWREHFAPAVPMKKVAV